MSQNVVLKAKGLSTHSNPLGAVPEGSMQEALNVVIDRNEIVEPRRGFFEYGTSFGSNSDRTKQLFNYKDRVLRHALDKLQFDADLNGLFLDVNSSTGPVQEIKSGLRLRSIEANGNFYFVSATGVRKISARVATDLFSASIELAGGVKALNVEAVANFMSSGFLSPNSKVAYRVVFGIKDINENLILGTPSSRVVVYNITQNSCNVDISFTLPTEINSTNYFYQVYRTAVFSADIGNEAPDPGDEMNLVMEDNITSSQLLSGQVDLTDITPEAFRKNGTYLYTNPNSGEGIEQSNERPPFGTDIALYKGYTFLANTKTVQRLNLAFLSIQGLTDNVSNFTITDGTTSTVYTFQGTNETFLADFTGTLYSDYVNSTPAEAKYFTIISSSDERKYLVWYYETANDQEPSIPGLINIKITLTSGDTLTDLIDKTLTEIETVTDDFNVTRTLDTLSLACSNNGYVTTTPITTIVAPFVISKDNAGTGEDVANNKIFLPKVPVGDDYGPTTSQQLEQVAKSLEKVVNAQDALVYAYYSSGFDDVPGQLVFENRDIVGAKFSLLSNSGTQFNPALPSTLSAPNQVVSNNEVRPNRIHYSKYQQPEAFPLANYIDIGPKDREIKRIIPLQDSLFIFKEDGIYRLSGETAPFTVAPFDFSFQVLAPDTATILNNQIYAFSTQGVVVVTDTGASVVSRPIENLLIKMANQCVNYKTASFGLSYESERSFLLWVPTNPNDTVATQCFRYNTFTNSWTRWDNSKTCGLVNFFDDKIYLGAGDENFVEKERKDLNRTDHADRQYELQVVTDSVVANQLELNLVNNVKIGDVLLQKQYLTISQFNRLLLKLDNDITIADNNYFATLEMKVGMNLRTQLGLLAAKMDADSGLVYTNYQSLIQNLSYSIIDILPDESLTIIKTSVPHNIAVNRYINIGGTDSTPNIDGSYKVLAVTSDTITIEKTIAFSGTTGTLQTNINNFIDIQTCFNLIIANLNDDPGAFFANYEMSENDIDFEGVVENVDVANNLVTLKLALPLVFGDITLYKAIKSKVIWNPQFFQDPTVEKQISQGTMMFETTNFSTISIGYSTDLSPSFEDTLFTGLGAGDWGQFTWGGMNWGGIGAPVPLRTYIPLEKQRCRFMNVKFEHSIAFERYSIYGLSLTFRPYNTRAYR